MWRTFESAVARVTSEVPRRALHAAGCGRVTSRPRINPARAESLCLRLQISLERKLSFALPTPCPEAHYSASPATADLQTATTSTDTPNLAECQAATATIS